MKISIARYTVKVTARIRSISEEAILAVYFFVSSVVVLGINTTTLPAVG